MSGYVIETRGLTKYYKDRKVVDSLNLKVPQGSVFALLGRNGAGKTTTIRMLLGLLEPSRGASKILGTNSFDLKPEDRARIGYLAEGHFVYPWMTLEQCEEFQSAFFENWNARLFSDILDYFKLDKKIHVKELSRGQRAGLCLALTLAPDPELLILDDPALGLDPVARRNLLESIIFITRESKKSVLFSSHLLSDVERVADYIAVMDRGVLKSQCSVDHFVESIQQTTLYFNDKVPRLPEIPRLLSYEQVDRKLTITVVHADEQTRKILNSLEPVSMENVPLSLEDSFLYYLGDRGQKNIFSRKIGAPE
jgi:ABC-2 type transport system ATP-binding protein